MTYFNTYQEFVNEAEKYKEGDTYQPIRKIKHQAQRVVGQSGTDKIMKTDQKYVITHKEKKLGTNWISVTRKDTTPEHRDYAVWKFNEYNFKELMVNVNESVNEAKKPTYEYEYNKKTKKYDVINIKSSAIITSFKTEDEATDHVDSINSISRGNKKLHNALAKNESVNERFLVSAKELGIDRKKVKKMNKELSKKNYSAKGIFVKREFVITQSGHLMAKEVATGRRTTPRELFRHLLHDGFTGNTKYAEIDNGSSYVENDHGQLHYVDDTAARGKGSITDYYGEDIDKYSEYETMAVLFTAPSKIEEDQL